MQSDSGCDFFCALIAQEGGTGKLVCFSTTASFACLSKNDAALRQLLLRQNFIFKESVRKSVKKSLVSENGKNRECAARHCM